MNDEEFRGGEIYDNVYLLAVDASGYSTIVKSNPRDRVGHAFDLLREDIGERIRNTAVETGCRRAHLWFWRGDGGLFLIHDGNESVARDVVLSAAWKILVEDLTLLRNKLRGTELKGELRLRIAVHKGPLRYMDSGYNGSIHSPDINFVTHLEEATPPDCIAISDEVYQAAGDHSTAYTHVGEFDERKVYLTTATGDSYDARRAWLAEQGLAGGVPHTRLRAATESAREVQAGEQRTSRDPRSGHSIAHLGELPHHHGASRLVSGCGVELSAQRREIPMCHAGSRVRDRADYL